MARACGIGSSYCYAAVVFWYFGYGSNMDPTSLAAKGVRPHSSQRAVLPDWRMVFDLGHPFPHEGGMGNIHPDPGGLVRGVLHCCDDEHMAALDVAEGFGVGYDRQVVLVRTDDDRSIEAVVYVGLPANLCAECLPTQRYINILVEGARQFELDPEYVAWLEQHPLHVHERRPPFRHPEGAPWFTSASLAEHPTYIAVGGAVFDLTGCAGLHAFIRNVYGGRDMTMHHLKRLDTSDGNETMADVVHDRLSDGQRAYVNEYVHAYADAYVYVGRYSYEE
jgi:sulfite reductase (NADPH) flavoprotein alpha-component